jgi:hypothetical protein
LQRIAAAVVLRYHAKAGRATVHRVELAVVRKLFYHGAKIQLLF